MPHNVDPELRPPSVAVAIADRAIGEPRRQRRELAPLAGLWIESDGSGRGITPDLSLSVLGHLYRHPFGAQGRREDVERLGCGIDPSESCAVLHVGCPQV